MNLSMIVKQADLPKYIKRKSCFLDITYLEMAKVLEITPVQFTRKMQNKFEFKLGEIIKLENYFDEKEREVIQNDS